MKASLTILATLISAAVGAVPVSWTVETSRVAEKHFDAYHGETLDIEAAFTRFGSPLPLDGCVAKLYFQTNGMDSAWWSVLGACSGNVARVTFLPSMDPGAGKLRAFVRIDDGASNVSYRASATITFRNSPGNVPNSIPLPVAMLDFSKVRTVNAPWIDEATADGRYAFKDELEGKADQANVYTKEETESYVQGQIQSAGAITESGVRVIVTEMGSEFGKVQSVNGKTGDVTIAASDVGAYSKNQSNEKFVPVYTGEAETEFNGEIVTEEYENWRSRFGPYGLYTEGSEDEERGIYEGAQIKHNDKPVVYGISTNGATLHGTVDLSPIAEDSRQALAYSRGVYNFMTGGRTNCWFSGTNYVFGADAATRTRFAWEDEMPAETVPCSMSLYEIRDGTLQIVWDQRDWPTWFWSFKSHQMMTNTDAKIEALGRSVTNDANFAWSKRYASDGTSNPDSSTTFIDTPSVTLSPGMKWETVAKVSGAAYWTIVGDGAVIGGNGTNAVLRIQDFEGNDMITITKGEHRLAWVERGEVIGQMYDADGWVCFDMLADTEPVGYFSTTPDSSDFLPQTDPNCPAQYSWENLNNGKYRVHFLLKGNVQASACFAKFQVEVEGETVVRYNAGHDISRGLFYNGIKIAPDISGSPAVGTVVQWKVVH